MALTQVPAHAYGGLNLSAAPDEVGLTGALDALNVELDRPGVVRSRDGTSQVGSDFAALSNGNWPVSFFPWGSAGFVSTMSGAGTVSISDGGAVSASRTTGAGFSSVPFGTPTATRAYIGELANLVRLESTTFTALGFPTGANLAVTANDNRLALAYVIETGPTTYSSRVRFSDAGAPETFGANNYVDLDPGNGESISAMAAWNGLLFVFKPSRIYVFYGNSVDVTGDPIFNYRRVETGVGCVQQGAGGQNCVCATPDGLYFVGADSLYRTTGGPPEKFPSPLDVLVKKAADPTRGQFFTSTADPSFSGSGISLSYASGYLFVTAPATAAADRCTFAYHFATGTWTFWNLSAGLFGQRPAGSGNMSSLSTPFIKTGSGADPGLWIKHPNTPSDGAVAISSRYRTGFYDLGQDVEKRTRGASVWGRGNLSYQSSKDFGSLDTATSLSLGTQVLNLASYPSVERGTTKWANSGVGVTGSSTITQDSTTAQSGTYSLKVATAATALNGAIYVETPATAFPSGTAVTAAIYIKGNAGGESLTLGLGFDGVSDFATTAVTATTGFQRFSVTTTSTASRTAFTIVVRNVPASAQTFFADALMVVVGSAVPAFFDTEVNIGRSIFNHPKDGTLISHQFSSVNGMPWAVHRHAIEMEPQRLPATKTP